LIEKIVNLLPLLDNFLFYITIVFTIIFCDEDDNIEKLKNTLKDNKEIFDTLISTFNKTKNIKKVNFSSIKILFIII